MESQVGYCRTSIDVRILVRTEDVTYGDRRLGQNRNQDLGRHHRNAERDVQLGAFQALMGRNSIHKVVESNQVRAAYVVTLPYRLVTLYAQANGFRNIFCVNRSAYPFAVPKYGDDGKLAHKLEHSSKHAALLFPINDTGE